MASEADDGEFEGEKEYMGVASGGDWGQALEDEVERVKLGDGGGGEEFLGGKEDGEGGCLGVVWRGCGQCVDMVD